MTAYYNEIDEFAADTLESLIARNLIPKGDVDRRSIEEVKPDDIKQYTQHHFFAGIGGWPYAFRLAGWPDDKPVWSGSVPCQPFSSAGKRAGIDDERHLWPTFFRLISECKPATIFGEQVSGNLGRTWLAAIRLDLESIGYACGAADLPAASVGAPHKRSRLFWVSISSFSGWKPDTLGRKATGKIKVAEPSSSDPIAGGLSNTSSERLGDNLRNGEGQDDKDGESNSNTHGIQNTDRIRRDTRQEPRGRQASRNHPSSRESIRICQPDITGRDEREFAAQKGSEECISIATDRNDNRVCQSDVERLERHARNVAQLQESGWHGPFAYGPPTETNAWSNVVYLPYRDKKWRPVPIEPGLFPLAHGIPKRVAKLRVIGNAIVPQLAAAFIQASGLLDSQYSGSISHNE